MKKLSIIILLSWYFLINNEYRFMEIGSFPNEIDCGRAKAIVARSLRVGTYASSCYFKYSN
jgi:hypothetical protein